MFTAAQVEQARQKVHAFVRHCQDHPEVYDQIVRAAIRLVARDATRSGMHAIMNEVRYGSRVDGRDADHPFKVSNDYQPLYARRLVAEFPATDPLFEMRPCAIDLALRAMTRQELYFSFVYVPEDDREQQAA